MGDFPSNVGPPVGVGLESRAVNQNSSVSVLVYSEHKYISDSGTLLIYNEQKYISDSGSFNVDSTNTAVPKIISLVQRVNTNIGDVVGTIYNTTGGIITLIAIRYSDVGSSGPFVNSTVLTTDPAYILPNGTPAGQAFNVPIGIGAIISGNIWIQMEINF